MHVHVHVHVHVHMLRMRTRICAHSSINSLLRVPVQSREGLGCKAAIRSLEALHAVATGWPPLAKTEHAAPGRCRAC